MPPRFRIPPRIGGAFNSIRALTAREQQYLWREMGQIKGLMPLLMKQRNKQKWTAEDLAELRAHMRRLSNLSPYLVVMVLPGSFALLPALAWWLDRRRGPRTADTAKAEQRA